MGIANKICSKCYEEKSLTIEFFQWRTDRKRWRHKCKICISEQKRDYNRRNANVVRERKAKYYSENKNEIIAKRNTYYKNNKDKVRQCNDKWEVVNNYGRYAVEIWDDNNKLTWKWNLDHIVPQCKLSYDSMDHINFKKCWALDNLRPLSAKANLLKGDKEGRYDR